MTPEPTEPDPTAWDALLDRVDRLVASATLVDPGIVDELGDLIAAAITEGAVDRELDPRASGRWLAALASAHGHLLAAHPEADADAELALLRVIITRWLHPGRLDAPLRA